MFLDLACKRTVPVVFVQFLCIWILVPNLLPGQAPSPNSVLTRSIDFHDPQQKWGSIPLELILRESRLGADDRQTIIQLDLYHEKFNLDQNRDGNRIQYDVSGDTIQIWFNGSTDFTAQQAKDHHLNEERASLLRDYYTYLYGLPMKLRDPGTVLHPDVADTIFNEVPVWSVQITYDEDVGGDTWYFYFDKESFALTGYRFYHDEAAQDGEFIILEDLKTIEGIRFPRSRSWYSNRDSTFLGKDIIE